MRLVNNVETPSAVCRNICSSCRFVVTCLYSMSDIEDCASQEIENSSNSTRNSKNKITLSRSIVRKCQITGNRETKNLVPSEIFLRQSLFAKRDYIDNWIREHKVYFLHDSSEKSSSASPVLGVKPEKRASGSPALGYRWKRARGNVEAKENTRLYRNERIVEPLKNDWAHDDPELTTNPTKSHFSNAATGSSSLTAGRVRRKLSSITENKNCFEPNQKSKSISKISSLSSPLVSQQSVKKRSTIQGNKDRVTCKFSWHRRSNGSRSSLDLPKQYNESRLQNSLDSAETTPKLVRVEVTEIYESPAKITEKDSNVCNRNTLLSRNVSLDDVESRITLEPESPLRWNGYQNDTRESLKIQSSSTNDLKDASRDWNERKSFGNSSFGDKNCTNFQALSPLRWNGYGSEIRDSSKPSNVLSLSSAIIAIDRNIQTSSGNAPTEELISDNQSSTSSRNLSFGNKKSTKIYQAESPLRWNGYHSEDRDSKLSDVPSLSSPIIERVKIVQSSSKSNSTEDLILDDQSAAFSGISVLDERKRGKKFQAESPSRSNGCRSAKSSKLTGTLSLSSPLIENELLVIQSSSTSVPTDYSEDNNRNDLPHKNSSFKTKKRPIKLETLFNYTNCSNQIAESWKLPDNISLSPTLIDNDVESVTTNAPEECIKIESDSDVTISDVIENVATRYQGLSKSKKNSMILSHEKIEKENFVERGSMQDKTCDSDVTYCSDGENRCPSSPEVTLSEKKSQNISQLTTNSREMTRNKSELISQASSPSKNYSGPPIHVLKTNATNNTAKTSKKAKKGSLVAKVQALVSLQISNLQIWQYQMSRPDFRCLQTKFVELTIMGRETLYRRHFLYATVIEDAHNLLNSLCDTGSNLSGKQTVTLMIVPEINGTMKIRDGSSVNIYPPWEIVDQDKRVLSIIYFEVRTNREEINDISCKKVRLTENKRVLEKFECPCIRREAIDDSCRIKFTNTKPSVMQAMFDP